MEIFKCISQWTETITVIENKYSILGTFPSFLELVQLLIKYSAPTKLFLELMHDQNG